ncbi:MAG: cell division protein ZapA [Altererythrobacter ishigakiensis]|nr:cell division protein ZapA [Altererythrobacter ishigakiensis]
MSEITLRIRGKAYKVACADGEEAHLARLGGMIDEKLSAMGTKTGSTEAQNLLFAALFLADELYEARQAVGDDPGKLTEQVKSLQQDNENAEKKQREISLELDAVRAERDAIANDLANIRSAAGGQETLFKSDDITPKLEQLAELIEKCADTLESRASVS